MPGAWEMRPEVLVAVLTREVVYTAWAWRFRDMDFGPRHHKIIVSGMPFDHARNHAVELALQGGFEWLFFLDDDVIAPPQTVRMLINRGLPIVSGLYYRRNEPIVPVMIKENADGSNQWITSFQAPSLVECDLVGAGCLLIHNTVLRKMSYPWFEWRVDRKDLPEKERASEDFTFCKRAKKEFGFKIYVDTGVQCLHCGPSRSEIGGAMKPLVAEGK